MIQAAGRPTVLIVDDEEVGRVLLEGALEGENYRLLTAASGADAVAMAREQLPDVIVLDVVMPGVSGYDVCRQLRSDDRLGQVPILFLTALKDFPSRQEGLAAGADEFLTKPVDVVELRTRLQTITRLNRFRLLAEERERFETVFEHSPDAIVIAAPDGRILAANRNAGEVGLAAGPEHSRTLFENFPDAADQEGLQGVFAHVLQTGLRGGPLTAALAGRDGRRLLEITASRLPWRGRAVVELTLRDITEKRRMEAWLMRSQRIDLLGQFASEIVHDVNNMLAAITLGTARLAADPNEEVRRDAARIEETTVRAGAVLRRILQFARGAADNFITADLAVSVATCMGMIDQALGRKIKLFCPSAVTGLQVKLDENQLHQLLLNLCVNARDAMGGAGAIEISVFYRELSAADSARIGQGSRVGAFGVLCVRDRGAGMTEEVKNRLFEPFFTTKSSGRGTGLGLAAVARIVQAHGGFVGVNSELGVGTSMECHFPLVEGCRPGPVQA
ncbi:MAG TPA: response regulator [Opitutaceae bacterium]|nr:response regulator [Opitutaceae bacterium]